MRPKNNTVKNAQSITASIDERYLVRPAVSFTISSEHAEHSTLNMLLSLNDFHNEKRA